MQINLTTVKDNFLKYAPYLAIVFMFLYFTQCGGNKEAEFATERQNLKKESADFEKKAKEYLVRAKVLETKEVFYKDTIAFLDKQNVKKQLENIILHKEKEILLTKVKMLNSGEIAQAYKERYHTADIKTTEAGTVLPDHVAKENLSELITFDATKKELRNTNEMLTNTQEIVAQKDSLNANCEAQNANLYLAIDEKDKARASDRAVIKSVEKSLRREKIKTLTWKTITVAVITAAGYLIIAK